LLADVAAAPGRDVSPCAAKRLAFDRRVSESKRQVRTIFHAAFTRGLSLNSSCAAIVTDREGRMTLPTLTYNDNVQEHRGFADTLGQLQGGILKGTYTRNSTHAYYAGHELRDGDEAPGAHYYLKMDCPGSGRTRNGRSQNRIIVGMTRQNELIEGWAVAWRHDDRLLLLSAGFFTRAQGMRDFVLNH
jgi:hypothetical protein